MNKLRILKYAVYAVEIVLALLIQGTPYLLPEIYGGKAILMLPLALSFAIFESDIAAMVFAVICGFLADCSYSGPIGFYVITLLILCFIVSNLNGNYIRTNLLTAMLSAVIGIPVILFLQFLFYYVFAGYTDAWSFFARHYISRIIYTIAFMPVFYGLNKLLNKHLK